MKHRKPNWWQVSALAAAMALPGASLAAQFSADFFSAKGWVKPGETYPFTLSYDAEGSAASGTISVTLPPEATFSNASVAPSSQSGQTLTFDLGAEHGAGKIIVWATADDLGQDPTIIWKNLSAQASYTIDGATYPSATLGPKVTTLESARYGKRPFPLVMVEYQDVHHCTGEGEPFPECTGNHTAEALDEAVNSRTSGRSLWQLFQDMSFGQLSPEGQVGPTPGTNDTAFETDYPFKWSTLQPNGTCNGTTTAPPSGKGAPLTTAPRIVNGWYRLPGTQGYYGSDRTGHGLVGALTGVGLVFGIDDACGPTAKITYDAAAIADPELDYNEFDTDKDGVVDFFNVAFAGEGGNGNLSATGLNNIWPHKSDLQYYFTDENGEKGYVSNDQLKSHTGEPMFWTNQGRQEMTTVDTGIPVMVRVGPYNVNPEAAIEKMSVIAHEYGHSLGLPDFYSTGSRDTFGSWELMASDHSQFMTVFTRQEMGWIVPREASDGEYTLRESKIDTGEIHWKTPDGQAYTLSGPGIHNADALRVDLPTIKLIDAVPSGVRAWHSGSGNDFGCPTTQGHNLDFWVPEFAQMDAGSSVELSFQSLYEIEWDWDYAFLMISTDGGVTWETVPSQEGTTLNGYNPNQADCYTQLGNGITGSSRTDPSERNSIDNDRTPASLGDRGTGHLNEAQWITDRFDLSAYAGNGGGVIIRFGYFTDPAVANRGWFIDDIALTVDGNLVYASEFEDEEHARIFPDNWSRVSSADGVDADHAYYIEVRDRVSWDFDSKNQSDRGAPSWQPGLAILYTDESHGYGNTGVDNPPAQTIVDSQPDPHDDTPNLDDAAYQAAAPREEFDGCTHVDNYDTPEGEWKLPDGMNLRVNSLSGLSSDGQSSDARATITIDVKPDCSILEIPPVLAFGDGHEDPDSDGSFELTWERPDGATGPDLVQEATILSDLLTDDAESGMGNWSLTTDTGMIEWTTSAAKQSSGNFAFFASAVDHIKNSSATMTTVAPITVPAVGTTTLSFNDAFGAELDEKGFVEVSNDAGASWSEVYQTAGPLFADEHVDFWANPLKARRIDLTPFGGQDILVRFRFFVGESNYFFYAPIGWFVDDIKIDTANWSDIAYTTGTSYERSGLVDGTYHYRVRTAIGESERPSPWSNVITTAVDVDEDNGGGNNGGGNNGGDSDVDLVVTDLVFANKKNGKGGPIAVTATITNFGTKSAKPVFHEFVLDGSEVMHRRGLPPLGPNGSVQVTMQWNARDVADGEHMVTSFADSDNEIVEADEQNNLMTEEIGVTDGRAHNN